MLTCKEATELMSQEQDRRLGFFERLGLRFHVAMCSGCRNYGRQMDFLRRACRAHPAAVPTESSTKPGDV
jgi:Putative zinc-finger